MKKIRAYDRYGRSIDVTREVGVDSELQQISRRLTGLAARRPGLAIALWGEPGIGKTHATLGLLRAAPCQSFTVRSTQRLADLVSAIPRPKKASVWLEGALDRLGRGEPQESELSAQTLSGLLAANAPMILHVEDLHEADSLRLAFWQEIARSIARTRGVGLLATSRVQPPQGFESTRLSSLCRERSDALLEAEAGAKLPQEALAWLFERAAGNPLFTLEFFRFLARQGFLWNDGRRWRWRTPEREIMPVTVEALIERALADNACTLPFEDALAAKAFLGPGAGRALWASVAQLSLEHLDAARAEFERRGVLFRDEFAHPLYGEVIAQGLPSTERQRLARRALGALEADPRAAARFVPDAGLEPSQALRWLEHATRAARDEGDGIQAARFLAMAVEFAGGEARARLALEAANGLRPTDTREAMRLAELAANLRPDDGEAIFLLADLHAQEHRAAEVERLIARIPEQQRSSRAWLGRIIQLRAVAGNFDGALEIWRAHPELHTDVDAAAYVAQTLYNIGEKDRAEALATTALARPDLSLTQRIELVNAQAIVEFARGNMARADELFDQTVAFSRQTGDPRRIGVALSNRSTARLNLGLYRETADSIEEALQLFGVSGHRRLFAQTQRMLGSVQAELGNDERAEELLLESLEMLEQNDTQGFLTGCVRGLCDLYREWDPPHGRILALRHAHAGLRFARLQRSPRFAVDALPNAAAVEAWNGNPQRALELCEEAVALVEQLGEPAYTMYTDFAFGLAFDRLGQPARALEAFRRVHVTALKLEALIEIHKSGLEIARLTDDPALARDHAEWFESRGLMNAVRIAHRYFPELAGDQSFPGTRPATPETQLRLEVLGSMQLRQNATITPVRGGKRKELLALLLEARIRGRAQVLGLDLCEALYPLEPEQDALGALKATIFKIRSSLDVNLIATTPNGYALGPVSTDAEDFLLTGDASLWRGPYLEDATIGGRDENVREALHHALQTQAAALLENGSATRNPREAARLGRILMRAEPYDLEALELTCRALRASENHKGLARLYLEAQSRMLEVGEALPDRWADFLERQLV